MNIMKMAIPDSRNINVTKTKKTAIQLQSFGYNKFN